MTCGSGSYSTLISFSASLAIDSEVAATAATGWPSYSAFSRAMALRVMSPSAVPALISGKSSRVITALTPGSFSAAEMSIDLMIACGCGERRILPTSMPGRNMSAPNLARPVTLSRPSCLTGEEPTIFSFLSGLKPLFSRMGWACAMVSLLAFLWPPPARSG